MIAILLAAATAGAALALYARGGRHPAAPALAVEADAGAAAAVAAAPPAPAAEAGPAAAPAPVDAGAAAMVTVDVESDPPGAEVRLADGHLLGTTPMHRQFARSGEALTLRLSLAGHGDQQLVVPLGADAHERVSMEPLPPATSPPPRHRERKPSARDHRDRPGWGQTVDLFAR